VRVISTDQYEPTPRQLGVRRDGAHEFRTTYELLRRAPPVVPTVGEGDDLAQCCGLTTDPHREAAAVRRAHGVVQRFDPIGHRPELETEGLVLLAAL